MGKRSNGEGCVSKRKDGRWQASIAVGFDQNGKIIRKYFYGHTRKEVQEKLDAFRKTDFSSLSFKEEFPLSQWMQVWLSTYKKHSVKSRTFEQYESISRLYIVPTLGKLKLGELQPIKIQNMLNKMYIDGKSRRTVELTRTVLRAALNQARKCKLIAELPTEDVVLPRKEPTNHRVLTEEEQEQLIQELSGNYIGRALIFALFTGLRRGEVLALKWSDFNKEEQSITVSKALSRVKTFNGSSQKTALEVSTPKTQTSGRSVPLVDKAVDLLLLHKKSQEEYRDFVGDHYKNQELIFSNSRGGYIDPGNLNRKLNKVAKKIGIPSLSSHVMRHTFATRGLEAGVSLKAMQEFLGHSSIKITGDIYTHLLKKQKKKEIEKMNNIF